MDGHRFIVVLFHLLEEQMTQEYSPIASKKLKFEDSRFGFISIPFYMIFLLIVISHPYSLGYYILNLIVIILIPNTIDSNYYSSPISQLVLVALISLAVTMLFSGVGLFKDQKKTLSIVLFIIAAITIAYGAYLLTLGGGW
jgi:hypothetical protein